MATDSDLLQRYADHGSEQAFADLVSRYLNLVYASAQRRVGGDAHAARDVAQQVFTALARNAPQLTRRVVLTGWLYTTTRNAASHHVRAERRRRRREEEAMKLPTDDSSTVDWDQLRPLIDDVMDALTDADREAVLLRYFENRSFAEIGAALLITEDAARVRVNRALDKLQSALGARGITSSAVALGAVLTASASPSAPAGLAAALTRSALSGAAAGGVLTVGQLAPVGVAITAAVVAVAAAFYQYQGMRAAQLALEAAEAARDHALVVEQAAKAELEHAEAQVTASAAQASLAKEANLAAATSSPAAMSDRPPTAAEVLAAHPEARELLRHLGRTLFEMRNGAALRSLNLSPDEYERAVAEGMKSLEARFALSGVQFDFPGILDGDTKTPANSRPAIVTGAGQPGVSYVGSAPSSGLAEILGPERMREFAAYQSTEVDRRVVGRLTALSLDADRPLSPSQSTAVYNLLCQHPGASAFRSADARAEVAGVLSPAQLELFDAACAQLLPNARRGPATSTGNP